MKTIVLLSLIVIAAILTYGCAKEINNDKIPQEKYCEKDNDCIKVKADCCGCSMGGKATTVNKEQQDIWNDNLTKNCKGLLCIAVISKDQTCNAKPKCDKNKCVLK